MSRLHSLMALNELKVEITDKCMLKCIHCSTGALDSHTSFLPSHVFKNIIEQAVKLGCKKVYLSGGEPLLHPEIMNFLDILQINGIYCKVYSCGITQLSPPSTITTKTLNSLKSKGLSHLVFSIYSSFPKTHDSITNIKGSFYATENAIKKAIDLSLVTEIHFVVTRQNIDELPQVAKLAETIGVNKISVLRFVPQGRGKISEEKLTPTQMEYLKLKETIIGLRNEMPDITIRLGSPFNFLVLGPPTPCTTGSDRMIIDVDGFAYPCDALKQVSWGNGNSNNVFDHSLHQIIDKAPLFKLVRDDTTPKMCKKCPDLNDCRSGCLAQRLLAGSNLSETIDPSCLKLPESNI